MIKLSVHSFVHNENVVAAAAALNFDNLTNRLELGVAAIAPWFHPAFHSASLGSNPKHTNYAFFNFIFLKLKQYLLMEWEKDVEK